MTQDLSVDSRRIQRILASREGHTAFWLVRAVDRVPLFDLSLEGFSVALTAGYAPGMQLPFVLAVDGSADLVSGEAEVANVIGGAEGRTGFHIRSISEADRQRLHGWLAHHVVACSGVPISEQDAAALVAGPSIV